MLHKSLQRVRVRAKRRVAERNKKNTNIKTKRKTWPALEGIAKGFQRSYNTDTQQFFFLPSCSTSYNLFLQFPSTFSAKQT